MRVSSTRRLSDFITGASEYLIARFRGCEIYLRPHPEERALARVSKDGRESIRCVHPSRRLLRKLLKMRSVSPKARPGGGGMTAVVLLSEHAIADREDVI